MTSQEAHGLVERQREFFRTGKTLDVSFRITMLQRLKKAIQQYEPQIYAAIAADLGKSAFESYMCEVGLVLSELSYMIKHIKQFAGEKRVRTPLAQAVSRSYQKPSPYGVTLLMSPWNYPFLLTVSPLTNAIAAGNTAIVKPSAYSPHTSAMIQRILEDCFEQSYVAVVTGGRAENACLLQEHFDHIFFTGSQAVGKEVLARAAEHLTPVTLELGGKSPCIVEDTARIPLAAKRIVFGKFLNCGQTCVAPDYIYCSEKRKDALLEELKKQTVLQFGENPFLNSAYGRIINEKHFDRIMALIDPEKVAFGGMGQKETLQIAPTVLEGVTWEDPVMQEEIFGPVLPVLTYKSLEEVIETVNRNPRPLALYLFSEDRKTVKRITAQCQFGGGCINDTVIHLATSHMGFGGVGESGMGAYHGKAGFETFSHQKSIVDKKTWLDLPMRYQPYEKKHEKILRMFLK